LRVSLCALAPPNLSLFPDDQWPLGLLIPAARVSVIGGKRETEGLVSAALTAQQAGCDDFWPAFARHIARLSTDKDRALLEELAAHPERRKGHFSWGLQYIVRGDVLLPDGTEVMLDELCDEAGVSRYPLLEDMPLEIGLETEAG
jgi:hypothetical protein